MRTDTTGEGHIYVLEDGIDDGFVVAGSIIPEVYQQEAYNDQEYAERLVDPFNREQTEILVGAFALAEFLQSADTEH